ncbi:MULTISPECIES: NACHT domain-containing NTPase [unclassified Streptomyces]|uniref:NACHT domain-containing protein n=1 Tax=unclassified Streptomyces TaxID=2593676 RepID=UPI00278C1974|nr:MULTISPECIES: NACHT domain-containing protein [unclassified Streptomyces]
MTQESGSGGAADGGGMTEESGGATGGPEPSPPVEARGPGAVGAGRDASYNATGKYSSVHDGRTYISQHTFVALPSQPDRPPLTPVEEEAAETTYARQLRDCYGRLDLEVLIPASEGAHPHIHLGDVFVPPAVRTESAFVDLPVELRQRLVERGELPDAGVADGVWGGAARDRSGGPPTDLLATLTAPSATRLVVLGDPGSGKSTLARYLLLALTAPQVPAPLSPFADLLPVVVELRRYADAAWRERTFEDFLAHVWEHEHRAPHPELLRRRLAEGRAVVVFDGLDELFTARTRAEVTRRIQGFASHHPQARIIVTSRLIGYDRHILDAAGFGHHVLQPLAREQITDFVRRWYAAALPQEAEHAGQLGDRLLDAVDHSRQVRELAGNPLLLTILAIIGRRRALPRDRVDVYRQAVDVLVARWDEETKHLDLPDDVRTVVALDDRDRLDMLELLARRMQEGREDQEDQEGQEGHGGHGGQEGTGGLAGNHVIGEDIERVFTDYLRDEQDLPAGTARRTARAMIQQFRERNFILCHYGSEVYGFVHRTFLEYLSARDVVRRFDARELTTEELIRDVVHARMGDPSWHEVILLVTALVSRNGTRTARAVVEAILDRDRGPTDTRSFDEHPPASLALRALGQIRRPGTLGEVNQRVATAAGRVWRDRYRWTDSLDGDLTGALRSLGENWSGRPLLLRATQIDWTGTPWMPYLVASLRPSRPWLLAVSAHGRYANLRAAAYAALVRCTPLDSDDGRRLVRLATEAPGYRDRAEILTALATTHPDDPAIRDLLLRRGEEDPEPSSHLTVLSQIGRQWPQDPDVKRYLRRLATQATSVWTRRGAVIGLALATPADAEGAAFLRDRAVHDPDGRVRAAALSWLVRSALGDPTLRVLLRERAVQDVDGEARGAALRTWFYADGQGPQAVEFVRRRIAEDPSVAVRSAGWDVLGGITDGAVRAEMLRSAVDDPDAEARRMCLWALSHGAPDDTDVRDLMLRHALRDPAERVRSHAVKSLLAHWAGYPATEEALNDAAAAPDVRRTARVTRLKDRAWRDTAPAAPDYLLAALEDSDDTDDTDDTVRMTAVDLLAALWPAAPDTAPALHRLLDAASPEDHEDHENIAGALATARVYARVPELRGYGQPGSA